jgi:hypothetical protein
MILDLSKISAFTSDGSVKKEMSPQDLHFLKGFKPNTLLGYNAAVKKFQKFMQEADNNVFTLPVSEEEIYSLCFWARDEEGQ